MANNGTIITPPVGFRDVQQVISESYNDLGRLCKSAKINKWAKFKPVVKAGIVRQLTYEELSNAKFGLTPIVNATLYGKSDASDTTTSPVSSTTDLENVLNSNRQWTYTPPSGGMAAPYRLTDFAPTSDKMTLNYGYHHKTPPPIEGVTGKVFDLSHINNCANNTTITSVAGESAYDWELNDTNNASPLYSGLAFRFGDASGDVVNNASTYAIALNEILGISNSENWRLAVAVQVPVSGQLSYMRVFTGKMTFEAAHALTSGKAQAIMPSLGTNQYLCKLIKDYSDYLYGMTAQEDVIDNKKLSLDTQTFSFVLPAMLCVVKDIGMGGVSRQGSSTSYTHALLTQGSTLYSAPALLTRFELTVNDNVHFTADQIKAYSLLLIKTDGTGQYAEFVAGQSASRVYINNLVLQQLDTVTQDTTIYYSIELTQVVGWSSGQAQTQTIIRSGSVTLTPGSTMQEWTIYAAPGLTIKNKVQSLNPI